MTAGVIDLLTLECSRRKRCISTILTVHHFSKPIFKAENRTWTLVFNILPIHISSHIPSAPHLHSQYSPAHTHCTCMLVGSSLMYPGDFSNSCSVLMVNLVVSPDTHFKLSRAQVTRSTRKAHISVTNCFPTHDTEVWPPQTCSHFNCLGFVLLNLRCIEIGVGLLYGRGHTGSIESPLPLRKWKQGCLSGALNIAHHLQNEVISRLVVLKAQHRVTADEAIILCVIHDKISVTNPYIQIDTFLSI